MKKRNCLKIFFLSFCCVSVFSINAQKIVLKEDFHNLSLDVELNKSEFLPLEPIFVQIDVSNKTDEPLRLLSIPDLKRLMVEITHNGTSKTHGSLFRTGPSRGSLGVTVKKGQAFSEDVVLEVYLSEMFPAYGEYQVRFLLSNGRDEGLTRVISSDVKEITIKEPTGLDKKAVEFLRRNQNPAAHTLFGWKEQDKGQELLETFVLKYSESKFGEYAIFQLGISYSNGGELEKAKAEFEKIKNSSNKYIADNANKSLTEIKQKKASLENMKKP